MIIVITTRYDVARGIYRLNGLVVCVVPSAKIALHFEHGIHDKRLDGQQNISTTSDLLTE
jgi:hypothetical protein